MERPRLHLYWLSVSASETTSHWASLITHYINITPSASLFPGPKPSTSTLSSSRSKGQTAAQSTSCQIYNTGEALRHILTFSQRGTWRSTASPGRCNLNHPRRPWGRSSLHRVNLSSGGKNYVDLKLCAAHSTAVTFNCQANLHCSTFKSASLSCALWRWTLTSFDFPSQRFFRGLMPAERRVEVQGSLRFPSVPWRNSAGS